MTRRVADEHGHLWPITGQRCPICRMPADPTLDGAPHPGCDQRPADPRPGTDRTALQLTVDLLGATHPTGEWVISQRPVRTLRPKLLTPPDRLTHRCAPAAPPRRDHLRKDHAVTTSRSMGSHQSARMGSDAWLTPPEWIAALGGPENFDLDPCAAPDAPEPWPTARTHYRQAERDGLRAPWFGRVWLNPPYGTQAEQWVARLAEHGRGTLLVAARTETRTWRRHIWGAATGILFVAHRPHFHHPDGTRAPYNSGAPVALVAYGADDAHILRHCGISGSYISKWHIPGTSRPAS